jgi:uncharacterized protein YjcR
MQQIYHANAKRNVHIRRELKSSSLKNNELTEKFNIASQTVSKWKNRNFTTDSSSIPNNIKYALNDIEQAIVVSL